MSGLLRAVGVKTVSSSGVFSKGVMSRITIMNNLLTSLVSGLLLMLFVSVQHARAVDYQLPDIDGQIQSLNQYKGKWVVVNYWATWCGTCMKELPDLISLHEDNKNGEIVVVGVNFESIRLDNLKAFIAEHSIPYPILHSKPVRMTPLGPVPALPTTYIVDPRGKVVAGEVGIVTQKNLEDYINEKKVSKAYSEVLESG